MSGALKISRWTKVILAGTLLVRAISGGGFLDLRTNAASTGTTGLIMIQGSGAGTSVGDYVSASTALNTSYHYFIEVPPGLDELKVEILDADVGMGGATEVTLHRNSNACCERTSTLPRDRHWNRFQVIT